MHMKVINRNKINTFFKNLKEYKDDEYFFTFEFYDYYLLNKNYLLIQKNMLKSKKYSKISQNFTNQKITHIDLLRQIFEERENIKKLNNLKYKNKNNKINIDTIYDLYPYRFRERLNLDDLTLEEFLNLIKFKFEEDDKNKGKLPRNKQNYRTGVFLCIWLTVITVLGLYFYFYFLLIKYSYLFLLFIIFIFYFFYKFFIIKKKQQNKFEIIEL